MSNLLNEKKRITSTDIRAAMSKRWTEPEYAIMWEVSNATGASSKRYADAIIMSLWPSRGLELHGVEIKISRSDWKREAANPMKAEAIAQFCDRWWVHTSPGVVDDLSDLPPAWGLREWNGKSWKTIREAAKNEPQPITRQFLAAMLRRADETMRMLVTEAAKEGRTKIEAEIERNRARFEDDLKRAVERKTIDLENSAKNIALFEAAFGLDASQSWTIDFSRLGRAAKALSESGLTGYHHKSLVERLRTAASEIEAIEALISPPTSPAATTTS